MDCPPQQVSDVQEVLATWELGEGWKMSDGMCSLDSGNGGDIVVRPERPRASSPTIAFSCYLRSSRLPFGHDTCCDTFLQQNPQYSWQVTQTPIAHDETRLA